MRLSKPTLRPDRHTRRLEARAGNAGGLPTHMIRKLLKRLPSPFGRPAHRRTTPAVIPASQHSLKRNQISRNAVTVVERLQQADRKSTRLNSSHVRISYAVFCLK